MQDIPPLFNHSDDTNVNFQLQFRSFFSHSFFLTVSGVYNYILRQSWNKMSNLNSRMA